ncbi:MAG: hypothetical protein ACE5K9_01415 [Candidatus Methylomirabilales bacterium]
MKAVLLALMVIVLAACAGPYYTAGSATVGTHGGSVSGTVSGPGASGTVTVPVPAQ